MASQEGHESSLAHVTGQALYVDDVALPAGALHVAVGVAEYPRAKLTRMDLGEVITSRGVATPRLVMTSPKSIRVNFALGYSATPTAT